MLYTEYFTLRDCSGFLQIRSHIRYIIHTNVLSGSKTGGTKAPAIHEHSMDYSHRSLMHAVAVHVNYFNTIVSNFINDDMIVLRATAYSRSQNKVNVT